MPKALLLILDGWGIAADPKRSAIDQAHTPNLDRCYQTYPHTQLIASGAAVGLPAGQVGNSEVGHLHLGAGRKVQQALPRIDSAIAQGHFAQHPILQAALKQAKQPGCNLHLLGLVSEGGVHAQLQHVKALCTAAHAYGVRTCYIHAFLDGRDTPPQSGLAYLEELATHCNKTTGQLATLIGRYYAMDRDQRWKRTQQAYEALVKGTGQRTAHWEQALQQWYAQGHSDELFPPLVVATAEGKHLPRLAPNDVVICFNFRPDRMRQLTRVLTQQATPQRNMPPLPLHYITFTPYDTSFLHTQVMFATPKVRHTLGELVSIAGKKQVRIAETEKYAHVTYFFSGREEAAFENEARILCPSPHVATYDQCPAMNAAKVTQATCHQIQQHAPDLLVVNLANADMVGHTGHWQATLAACETVDCCVGTILETALKHDYGTMIVADHGNADCMKTLKGQPYTAHTAQPVPCIWATNSPQTGMSARGSLIDVAPTLLKHLQLPVPETMTGKCLWHNPAEE